MSDIAGVSNAIKYIQGLSVTEGTVNFVKDTTDAIKQAPSLTIFDMAPRIYNGARYGLTSAGPAANGFSGAWHSIKDIGSLADGLQLEKSFKAAGSNYDALSAIYRAKSATGVGGDTAKTANKVIENIQNALKSGNKELLFTSSKQAEEIATLAKQSVKKPGLFAKIGKLFGKTPKTVNISEGVAKVAKSANETADAIKVARATTETAATATEGVASAAKAGATVAEGAAKTGIGSKIGSAFKKSGAGFMLAIEGILEVFTNVVPAFQAGGAESGMKQVGKSAVKVGASTAGFVGGSMAGKAVGSFLGSFIPIPGVGTVVGGMLGSLVGGMIGSSLASNVAKKITGKSEVELLQEKTVEKQAQAVSQNSQAMAELNQTVAAKVQQDVASNNVSDDTKMMIEYLNSGGTVGLNTQYNTNIPANTTQSFTGQTPQGQQTTAGQTAAQTTGTTVPTVKTQAEIQSGLNELIARVNSGDTSVFDVPDSAFDSIYANSANLAEASNANGSASFANDYTNSGLKNPYSASSSTFGGNSIFGSNTKTDFYAV